jgi:hypothetical protein
LLGSSAFLFPNLPRRHWYISIEPLTVLLGDFFFNFR